ncbi:MAG TPA: NAD(P)/FAD-dependent oxidoreductase [Phycisphaerae bacterium]|nr:NAD(P)/FAD-dependent oxidoreductase [Phycisphaerae bacterium]
MVVVGAGPAGLLAAITAAESRRACPAGAGILVLEQLQRPGAKLLASGGGRCNLTNTLPSDAFAERFGRQGRFIQPALAAFGPDALRRFLDSLGVPTHAPDGLHVYPAGDSAAAVRKALLARARDLGVALRLGVCAAALDIRGDALRGLATSAGPLAARTVVLATGGRGYPALGGSDSGYLLARQAGHTIIEPTPALVPLVTRESWPGALAGLSLDGVRVHIDLPRRKRAGASGDVLFTHRGLSGPAILDLSGDVARVLRERREVPLRLDLVPGTSAEDWLARFDAWAERDARKAVRTLLAVHVPRALADCLCRLADVDLAARPGQVSRPVRRALAGLLTALPLTVVATEGWDRAMVTRGGVALKEVDPKRLASRRLAGLFFAGELLDLDGPSGGFNLQWAFSSGRLAGLSV